MFADVEFQPTPQKPSSRPEFIQGLNDGIEKGIAAKLLGFGLSQDKINDFFQRIKARYSGESLDIFFYSLLEQNSKISLDAIWRNKPGNFRGDGFNWIVFKTGLA